MKQLKLLIDTKLSSIRAWYAGIGTITNTDLLKDLIYVCLNKMKDGRISKKTQGELECMVNGFEEVLIKEERIPINVIREFFVKGARIKCYPEYNILIDELISLCSFHIKRNNNPESPYFDYELINELSIMKTFFTRLKDSDSRYRLRDTYIVAMRMLRHIDSAQTGYERFNLANDYATYIDTRLCNGDITIGDKNFFMNKYYDHRKEIYKNNKEVL